MKKISNPYLVIGIILVILLSGLVYLVFTPSGSKAVLYFVLSKYSGSPDISIASVKGSLAQGITVNRISAKSPKYLPEGTVIEIQDITAKAFSFDSGGVYVEINNGQMRMPGSDTIVFYGAYKNRKLDFTVYSKTIYVQQFLDMFIQSDLLTKIDGVINDFNASIVGGVFKPKIKGNFLISDLVYDKFSLTDVPIELNVKIKGDLGRALLYGDVIMQKGTVRGPTPAVINLNPSKIIFQGDLENPSLDIKAASNVSNTAISIELKGTFKKPDLVLTSDPPMSQQELLLMLATGTQWSSLSSGDPNQDISQDLANDFLNYLISSGSNNEIMKSLGIDSVSVTYNGNTQGAGISKNLSDKTSIRYGVEQNKRDDNGSNGSLNQTVGGEYKLTDSVSLDAQTTLSQSDDGGDSGNGTNGTVTLNYKKKF